MRHGPLSMGEVIFIMNSPQEEFVQRSYMFVCEISSISRHFKENMKIKLLTLCNSRMMFSVQISKGKLIALLKFFSLPLKRKHPKRKASSIPSIMIRGYLELHGHTANVGLVVRLGHFVWTKHAKVGNGRIVWVYQIDVYCLIMGHCILYVTVYVYIGDFQQWPLPKWPDKSRW